MTEHVNPQRVAIWPATPEGEAERQAYMAWATDHHPESPDPFHAPWMFTTLDAYSQPWCTVCEYRPDWSEYAGGAAMRPNAILHDSVVPAPIEEE